MYGTLLIIANIVIISSTIYSLTFCISKKARKAPRNPAAPKVLQSKRDDQRKNKLPKSNKSQRRAVPNGGSAKLESPKGSVRKSSKRMQKSLIARSKSNGNVKQRLKAFFEPSSKENPTQASMESIEGTQPYSNDQLAVDPTLGSPRPVSSHGTLDELVPVARFRERHAEIIGGEAVERKNKEYGTLKFVADLESALSTENVCARERRNATLLYSISNHYKLIGYKRPESLREKTCSELE